jgi:hypothetical protein
VLPRFTPAGAATLAQAFGASEALQGGNRLEAVTWFERVARVREGAGHLADALRYAEALGSGATLELTVGQLPFEAGARWVALPAAPASALPGSRLSLVACGPLAFAPDQPVAGLVVDEWTEVVPSARETTGVVFHYDEPGARAPHAILLAVAPDTTRPWDLPTIEAVVLEALELAKIRMVDTDALLELNHYLPGLYFAINAAGDTISTNFRD